jgi:predicted SprT family Zn-dependent metalloprotease
MTNTTINQCMDINYAHKLFCHCGSALKTTAKIHDLKLSGNLMICEDCAVAKAKLKNVSKFWTGSSKVVGERLLIDIS